MNRILILCVAVTGLIAFTQATVQAVERPDTSIMAASQWPNHSMLSDEHGICRVDTPAHTTQNSTSRLSDMLLQHRAVSRLSFNPDIAIAYQEAERVEQPVRTVHCS